MKKTLRKLSLSRETLHALERLPQVVGGAKPGPIVTAGTSDYTLSCPDLCHLTEPLTELC
jgi:hypothetical protein